VVGRQFTRCHPPHRTGLEISSAITLSNAIGANSSSYAAAVIERVGISIPNL